MDERQDIEKKGKNIAQLMVELTTVQAQIKLVKAAIFMNKQKAAISTKMKDLRHMRKDKLKNILKIWKKQMRQWKHTKVL